MKYIVILLIFLLGGCSSNNNKEREAPLIVAKSGFARISISNPYYAMGKDILIDTMKDGKIVVTYTDIFTGNIVTIDGDCEILDAKEGDYIVRDWSKE